MTIFEGNQDHFYWLVNWGCLNVVIILTNYMKRAISLARFPSSNCKHWVQLENITTHLDFVWSPDWCVMTTHPEWWTAGVDICTLVLTGDLLGSPESYTKLALGVCTPRPQVTLQITQTAIETRPRLVTDWRETHPHPGHTRGPGMTIALWPNLPGVFLNTMLNEICAFLARTG